jgi:DNA invertase Pin-like site-specific DNA recombinase
MALIGLVRVSTDRQRTQRQHDALDPICLRVIEERASGKLATSDRPDLLTALSYIREGDLLTVQEVDRLGRNLLEGLIVLNDLFQQGVGVKVLEGIAAGEHTERSFILDLALALAEDRRRDIVRKTRNGLEAARKQGKVGGRRPVVDDDKRAAILDRRRRGESIRTIAVGVNVSVGVVHKTLVAVAEGNPAPAVAGAVDGDEGDDVLQDEPAGVPGDGVQEPATRPARSVVPGRQAPGRVHIPAGFLPAAGDKVKAACTCGWTTTARTDENRALAALETQHGYQAETCQLCGRDRRDDEPHSDRCRQLELDQAASLALGADLPRPALRLLPTPTTPRTSPADVLDNGAAGVPDVQEPATREPATREPVSAEQTGRGRVVDLSADLGEPAGSWQVAEIDTLGTWQVLHHGSRVGSVRREATTRGRRGWSAVLDTGLPVAAPAGLATATGSTLWRTRDLAVAGIAQATTKPRPRTRRRG